MDRGGECREGGRNGHFFAVLILSFFDDEDVRGLFCFLLLKVRLLEER